MTKKVLNLSFLFCLFLCSVLIIPALATDQETFPFVAQVTEDNVNVRAGQSANFEKLGQLQMGEQVVVVDRDYSWYKIKLPLECESYISAKFVTLLGQGIGKISGSRVNIRARDQRDSAIVGQVDKDELVRVKDKIKDWYHIEPVDDSYGWVSAEFILFKSREIPPPRKVQLPTRNIYKKKRLALSRPQNDAPPAPSPAPKPEKKEERLSAIGIIEDLGDRTIAKDIRHRLVVDEQTSYFLQGHRWIIDGFLSQKVSVEGKVQSHIKAQHPVLLVTKIHLIL